MDENREKMPSEAAEIIKKVFGVWDCDITNIEIAKAGMTNRSFFFDCKGHKYIIRIPGEGTEQLIKRSEEEVVYRAIAGKGLCDDVTYINAKDGYKITKYVHNARVCNPMDMEDVALCLAKLKEFHRMRLGVAHEFDIYGQIQYYEQLRQQPSIYEDYEITKASVWQLKPFVDCLPKEKILTHIDAVPDNFLFTSENEETKVQLIDWEYAGMQDPHVDIAMFCIYAGYGRDSIDHVIDLYFEGKCQLYERVKCYCYIASCGLLWSNWCEYKSRIGIEFGEYALKQYLFAKEYSEIAAQYIREGNLCEKWNTSEERLSWQREQAAE